MKTKTAKSYLRQPYARIVVPAEEGGFHGEILEFPGCYAQGESVQEVYKNLARAAEDWIKACIEQGQEVPEPFGSVGYSGHVALRLPKSIHRQATKFAELDRTSLNTFFVSAISSRIGAEDFCKVLTERFEKHLERFAGRVWNLYTTSSTPTFSAPQIGGPINLLGSAQTGDATRIPH